MASDLNKEQEKSDDYNCDYTRKRKVKKHNWKKTIKKIKRESGQEYVDHKNKIHLKRKCKGKCLSKKGFLQCEDKISQKQRQAIFNHFWTLTDAKKNHFYGKFVTIHSPQRKRTKAEISKKLKVFLYFFETDRKRIQVCRNFFLTTLDIDKQRIYYFFKNHFNFDTGIATSPLKGKYIKYAIPDNVVEGVRAHIKSFPCVDSHYCRANSSRKFLESKLNITIMYDLYLESEFVINNQPVKLHKYREIFNTAFNYGFYIPRKDRCDACEKFQMTTDPSPAEKEGFDTHTGFKVAAKLERDKDRVNDVENTAVICFDMENVFCLPKANVKKFFYKRKLQVFNMTAHCSVNGVTYCCIWHEAITGRGANVLASAISKILNQIIVDVPNIKKMTLWSDACVPQNRNKMMSMALIIFLNQEHTVQQISQKFSEPGHSQIQELDSIHSKIERYFKNIEVYSPVSLMRLLKEIPKRKAVLKIIQLQKNDFFSYSSRADNFNFKQIPYSQIRSITYNKNSECVYYKLTFASDDNVPVHLVKKIASRRNKNEAPQNLISKIPLLKEKPDPKVLADKKDHIMSMVPYIPDVDKEFYKAIFNNI